MKYEKMDSHIAMIVMLFILVFIVLGMAIAGIIIGGVAISRTSSLKKEIDSIPSVDGLPTSVITDNEAIITPAPQSFNIWVGNNPTTGGTLTIDMPSPSPSNQVFWVINQTDEDLTFIAGTGTVFTPALIASNILIPNNIANFIWVTTGGTTMLNRYEGG